jgi:C4-dicarboxylate-specific signal transduction histidine kinase
LCNELSTFESALRPDDKLQTLAILNRQLYSHGVYDIEFRLRTKTETYRWFNARGHSIAGKTGQPYLISGSIQDIHDKKQAEATLRQQEEYLIQKQKMQALGELAGDVAHEFNNILQA